MKTAKREKLEAAGWKAGDAADFLGLSRGEAALVACEVALAKDLRRRRARRSDRPS